jgi:hypothetical protein
MEQVRVVSGCVPLDRRRETRHLLLAGRGRTAQIWVLDRVRQNPPENSHEWCPDDLVALGEEILRLARECERLAR